MIDWKNKIVLVTGSSGLVGKELVILLRELGALIHEADIKEGCDLREYQNCRRLCQDKDYVFHCAGIKGSPKMTQLKPLAFMEPMLQFDVNMIRAARECKVKRFLYTSSLTVYYPDIDVYPSWTKMTAEKVIEATRIQYPECHTKYAIVRPASIYGKYDDFSRDNPMVVPSLIRAAMENKLEQWGDGSQTRDFINAKDVALGMIKVVEEMPEYPVNLGSGNGVTIKELIQIISKHTQSTIKKIPITNQILGADSRVMERNWENPLTVSLDDGIKEVIDWLRKK